MAFVAAVVPKVDSVAAQAAFVAAAVVFSLALDRWDVAFRRWLGNTQRARLAAGD